MKWNTLTRTALDTDKNQQADREEEYIQRRIKAEDQLATEKAKEEKKVMVHSLDSSGLTSAFKLQNLNFKTYKGYYTKWREWKESYDLGLHNNTKFHTFAKV